MEKRKSKERLSFVETFVELTNISVKTSCVNYLSSHSFILLQGYIVTFMSCLIF